MIFIFEKTNRLFLVKKKGNYNLKENVHLGIYLVSMQESYVWLK